jgi:hypothetical protein
MGDGLPPRGGSLRPPHPGRGGGGGGDVWGERGSARRQAAYERGDARRGGTGACRWDDWGQGGGHAGGGYSAHRAPEEEEAGILHPEVGGRSPIAASFRSVWDQLSRLRVRRVAPTVPPLAPAKVLRSDAAVPTRRCSSSASRATASTTTAASRDSRGAAGVS